ncbi:calpain family cysteine protease [Oesophagostomum dentatum]|uniref:Calpain family cysteine protease n=2 Tax=Oesophagostomum dentatum TaxID=61180 RepID=A0A0B1TG78_OESDE|nr:calpain family cysteine protease [Oesophagostomum dentatum]
MTNKRRFGDQNYVKIKKTCIKKGQLFVDTVFPPTNASLFLEQGRSSDIVWKRPAELHDDPHLFVEGASPNDVTQGILGNCWFVSACSALTHNQHLLNRVIPDADSQEWSPKNEYVGVFRFRFWRFGRWVEVVIDDLLPTRLYGCYESLVGGHLSDALQDVSGGVAETINVAKFLKSSGADSPDLLFNNLKEAFDNEALIVAAIAANTKEEIEQTLDCGLVKGHAYAVTAVKYVELDAKSNAISALFGHHDRVRMIRLQNPWGEKEWNGPWSDYSEEWEQVTLSQKHSLGITVEEDGDFWMPWYSFVQYFTDISVCQLFNTKIFSTSKRYHEEIFYGEWTTNGVKSGAPDDLAGGCLNFSATFCSNPQYLLNVSQPGEIMFALTQKEPNEGTKKRDPYVTIGIHVMKVENNRVHRIHQVFLLFICVGELSARKCPCAKGISVTEFLKWLYPMRYHEEIFYGEWTTNGVKSGAPDDLAGGCLNFSATFCSNPQYLLNVSQPGEIMFALTQKEPNEGTKKRDPYVTIGIHVMKVENNRVHRIHQAMTPVGTSDYASARSVFLHLRDVPTGRYIAVPTTFAPREQTTFMLRIYSDHKIDPRVLRKHAPSQGLFGCGQALSVIRITIVEAMLEEEKELNAYCILECGKQKVRTKSIKGRTRVSWNEQFIFHRKPNLSSLSLELWNDIAMARDRLLSKINFEARVDNDTREIRLSLDDPSGNTIGHIKLIVAAFDDPMYL